MITKDDLISIGVLKRTRYNDLPKFIFMQRDGLFIPFRSENIADIKGEEAFVLKRDMDIPEDEMAWVDFEGWTVQDHNTPVGKIIRVDDSTMNIFAELEDGRMLPLHEDFIIEINEETRVLRLKFPFAL